MAEAAAEIFSAASGWRFFLPTSPVSHPKLQGSCGLRYPLLIMHDLNYFRDHLDVFAEMAKKRWVALDLETFRALDKERRELITSTEQRKAQRNKASEEIARLKKEKKNADALIAEMKQVSERIKQSDERIAELDATQRELLLMIPNLPRKSPALALLSTKAGVRASNGRSPISSLTSIPANTLTRKFCHPSSSTARRSRARASCQNSPRIFSSWKALTLGLRPLPKSSSTISIATKPTPKKNP